MGRNPDPIGVSRYPETGTPHVAILSPDPNAPDPKFIVPGRFPRRPVFKAFRPSPLVLSLAGDRAPESGHPLVAVVHLDPIAGNPGPIRRHRAPKAADPNEILGIIVP